MNDGRTAADIHDILLDGVIGRRFLGWLIDLVILGVGIGLVWLLVLLLGFLTFGLSWFLLGGLWVIPILYAWLFVASPGAATPGQRLAGLRLVQDETLAPPTPAQALVWSLIYAITASVSGGVLLLIVFVTNHKRALHDLASGLTVVRDTGARFAGPGRPA